MATPNVGILTNSGKTLIDQVNAGQTKITFSKIVFSSMDNNQLTDDQIKALKTVAPQEIVVNNPEVTLDNNTGETRIRATGNNKALTDGVYVKTYAVYAKDDSGNEILYGITVSPNPNYLPEYDGVTPQAVTYSYKVNISNTGNITFSNSNDIYVSDTDLSEALQPYAKTVDVNQQLDKKVNVSDMRRPASDVAGIEEVAKDNYDGTITADGTIFNLLKSLSASSIPQDPTKDYNILPQGLAMMTEINGEPANMPPVKSNYLTLTIASSFAGGRKRQLAWLDAGANSSNNNYTYIRYCVGSTWSSWDSIPTSAQISSLIPSTIADTTKDTNFTRKLQKSGIDVATTDDVNKAVNTATTGLAKESDISGFYHQNTDDSSAKSAAESATTAGIYLFTGGMYYADGNGNATSVFSLALPSGTSVFNDTNFGLANADANHPYNTYNGANNGQITGNFYQPSINLLYGVDYLNNGIKITFSEYLISVESDGYTTNNGISVSLNPIILSKDSPNATVSFEGCTEAFNLSGNTVTVTKYVYGDSSNRLVPIITSITAY